MKNLLPLIALSLFIGCSTSYTKKLDAIEEVLWESPETALDMLQEIDWDKSVSRNQEARRALLMSIALDKNYIDVTSDSLVRIALDYYAYRKDVKNRMFSWYYYGVISQNMSNYTSAIIAFDKAESDAILLADNLYLGLILRHKGEVFSFTNNNPQSVTCFEEAVKYFSLTNKQSYIDYAKLSLATVYVNSRLFGKAESVFYSMPRPHPDSYIEDRISLLQAQIIIEQKDSSEKALKLFEDASLSSYQLLDYPLRAMAHEKVGQRKEADHWTRRSYTFASDEADTASVDAIISHIALSRGQYSHAFNLINHASQVQDSLTRILLQQSLSTAQRDYYKDEERNKETALQRLRQIMLLSGVALCLILVVIVLFFIIQSKKKEQEMKEQMAKLVIEKDTTLSLQKENAALAGSLFRDKFMQLRQISESYFDSDSAQNKELVFQTFKQRIRELRSNDFLFNSLEDDLNRYCNQVMSKLRSQVPAIKGENLKIISLFFAGLPYNAVQLIIGANSVVALKTARSRFRSAIKNAHAKDSDLLLEMLEIKKRPTE